VSWAKGFAAFALAATLGSAARAAPPASPDAGAPSADAGATPDQARRRPEPVPPPRPQDLLRDDFAVVMPYYHQRRADVREKRREVATSIAAEKARPRPDKKTLARLRREDAQLAAEEARWTRALAASRRKEERRRAEESRAFQWVGGVNSWMLDGVLH
jgi:hypothetical protein